MLAFDFIYYNYRYTTHLSKKKKTVHENWLSYILTLTYFDYLKKLRTFLLSKLKFEMNFKSAIV